MEVCKHEDSQSGGSRFGGNRESERAYRFLVVPLFIWIGFVLSISFMEAWLKFQAPQVTLAIGLGIGKIIFQALNRVEWVLAATTALLLLKAPNTKKGLFYLPVTLLLLQTVVLLPILNERADALAAGITLPPSWVHPVYLITEVVKVVSLFLFGIKNLPRIAPR